MGSPDIPDYTALKAAIVQSLHGGNGRLGRVRGEAELESRLAEDGVDVDPGVFYPALGELINEGRVESRPGVGIWLADVPSTLRVGDGDPTYLGDVDGPSWGP